jgi:hypothetical protein
MLVRKWYIKLGLAAFFKLCNRTGMRRQGLSIRVATGLYIGWSIVLVE